MSDRDEVRVVSARGVIHAPAATLFEHIADPALQPAWAKDNLDSSAPGQRVRAVGDVFVTLLTSGKERHNHVVEYDEGRLIAWCPAEPGKEPPGHLWRWELRPLDEATTEVVHTYDWTQLHDPNRLPRARRTDSARLQQSIDNLAAVVAGEEPVSPPTPEGPR